MSLSEYRLLRVAFHFLLHEPGVAFVQILMLLNHEKVVGDELLNFLWLDFLGKVVFGKLLVVGPLITKHAVFDYILRH